MASCCDLNAAQNIRDRLMVLGRVIRHYSWLINSYTTDYFTEELYTKFPTVFQKALLEQCSLEDLASLLPVGQVGNQLIRPNKVLPLSFLAHRAMCQYLVINPNPTHSDPASGSEASTDKHCADQVDDSRFVFGSALDKYFRVCVKPKKKHEVDLLAQLIARLCKRNNCEHVVDVGAGLGHLSRLLSFNKHLRVTTIEAAGSHSPKAQRLDKQTEELMYKQKVSLSAMRPDHISHWIEPDISLEEFSTLIRRSQHTHTHLINNISNKMADMLSDDLTSIPPAQPDCATGLNGLHACGDLTPTILRVYSNLDCAKQVTSIGCCYMKLSFRCNDKPVAGFPMSDFVNNTIPEHKHICTWEGMEMACHNMYQYHQRLKDNEESLRRHAVRAALQTLIYRRRQKSDLVHRRLKIKHSEKLPFSQYCERAFNKLGLKYDVTSEEINQSEKLIDEHWRSVVGMYTIRLSLSPLVETFILLDRLIFLFEQGHTAEIRPLFDPFVSPRNLVLFSTKTS